MHKSSGQNMPSKNHTNINPSAFFIDLILYLAVMFLIREVYFQDFHFIANGLFWSLSTLIVATWRMHARGISWKDLGLCKPEKYKTALIATAFIFIFTVISIIVFQAIMEQFPGVLKADVSNETAVSKFGNLSGNWLLFLTIIPFVLLQSMLEELLDRGFLINWIERMFSSTLFATIFAVIAQALIFGFRHSYDISERSISVAIIGLVMGIGYVAFGRNLWPLIIAHCVLNTMSMLDRVT
ncbi:CPBP family intramembrane glutamic endopeptidase [Marinicella sp. W31]|uniref:CPBP family intramembrane glutamic endopeptidase n=1 Tax=Marinicella sp. W31 TaxID=3023713 RepID=UPI003757644F